MRDNVTYIAILTVVEELVERVNNVFAERLKLETPFVSASTTFIRGFFMCKISGLNLLLPDSLKRYMKRDEFPKIQSRVFKGRTGRNAKYSISGISERKGDDLTGSIPDHTVVAHSKNNKQYRINDFVSTCLNSYCFTGLVIGYITLYPLKE
jgi:hypothetical protein